VYQRRSLVAINYSFFSVAQQTNSGLTCLNFEVSRPHSPSRTSLNVCSARRRGRYLHKTQQTRKRWTSLPSAAFEPSVLGKRRLQTYTLYSTAIGIDEILLRIYCSRFYRYPLTFQLQFIIYLNSFNNNSLALYYRSVSLYRVCTEMVPWRVVTQQNFKHKF
jgi:hypothetical protein